MIKVWFTLSILIIISCPLYPQQNTEKLELINNQFQSFEYQAVIENADSLLTDVNILNDSDKVEIYRLKGVSHYSLLQMRLALNSFINILKLNPNYEMSPIQNSPKIVKYFNEIKNSFSKDMINAEKREEEFNKSLINQRNAINKSIGYSILLPGLGHLQNGETTKGWGLISAAVITLGSSVYFILDTNKKEDDYLSEIEKSQIEIKYNKYNDSYKYRNYSLISFAAVWLYSQIDLLFFNEIESEKLMVNPMMIHTKNPQLNVIIHF